MIVNGIQNIGSLNLDKIKEVNQTLDSGQVNFSELLADALNSVNADQNYSTEIGNAFLLGEIDSVHDVSIAGMKADLSLNLAVEVTNKLLAAYSEIMRLQL
ncbi:flagellar hook-basal body complex protein FliE [Fusibacter tunisiensis]|uniref:Flagellar hook-basal body complex protein FliE n=1 Tax=Fusibacter tunisiensis TaxID=1008308 RepID=A0ABS2MMF1_9FIRM|nr:flagellar hook-basal body complex protein FliE [Fusibacter tunisiensis]MBM7560579.1 flagellar hook-basal body complex protein FliE [Fusibacter tunisiensis]